MCVTLEPALLSNTILYGAEVSIGGETRHVLGYQNRAANLAFGPNAMILPFPSRAPMTSANVVDTSSWKEVLTEYAAAVRPPPPRSGGRSLGADAVRSVEIFDSGMYTVVLASDARAIPGAIAGVPEQKRPPLRAEIFEAYAHWYPGWPIALCCFDGRIEPEPLLWWYLPQNSQRIFLPALDAHSGAVPNLDIQVNVDHTVAYGSTVRPFGHAIRFGDNTSRELRQYLAPEVIGAVIKKRMPNGDFWLDTSLLQRPLKGDPERLAPPGAPAAATSRT